MSQIQQALISLGLTVEEVVIYELLLEKGPHSILHVSQKTGVPRTSVYVAIEGLTQKSLVVSHIQEGKKTFAAADPQEMLKYGRRQKESLSGALETIASDIETMQAIYSKHAGKPVLRYSEGGEAISRMLTATVTGKECRIYQTINDTGKDLGYVRERYYNYLRDKQVNVRLITVIESARIKNQHSSFLSEYRALPARFAGHTDIVITEKTVTYLIFKQVALFGAQIDDGSLAKDEVKRFDMVWQLLDMLQQFSA